MRIPFIASHYILMCSEKIIFDPMAEHPFAIMVAHEAIPGIGEAFHIDEDILFLRFAHGDTCFLLKEKGRLLGMMWGHIGPCYIRGCGKILDLHHDEAYLYGVFTRPEERRKNVFTTLKYTFYNYYSERRIKKYFTLVAPANSIMRSSFKKDGYTEKINLFSLTIGNKGILYEYDYESNKSSFSFVNKQQQDLYSI